MNTAFYTAGTGMIAHQRALNVTANNMANVQTAGFKDMRPSFEELLHTKVNIDPMHFSNSHGVKMSKTDIMFTQGGYLPTQRNLDFVAPEERFFAVADANGNVYYTKDGSFELRLLDDTYYLSTSTGMDVLNADLEPITLEVDEAEEPDTTFPQIKEDLACFYFTNPYGLNALGNNCFEANDCSGEAILDENMEPIQGYLENSVVDVAEEMVRTIETQRAFQFSSKLLQTADELQNIVNNLR